MQLAKAFVLILFTIITSPIFSQNSTVKDQAVRVFLDCSGCDSEHIRKELTIVNYVRDRKDAQVHILSTREFTGSGGMKETFFFIGQNEYKNQSDTLSFSTTSDITEDERRTMQVNTLTMGLVRYIAKTPFANKLQITLEKNDEDEEKTSDKWNSWVFETYASAFFNGEHSYQYLSGYSSLKAQRITEDLKVEMEIEYDIDKEKYVIEDTTIYSTSNSKGFNHLLVKSINDHWSIGYKIDMGSSLYLNYNFHVKLMPAIEYNIFPYSKSNRQQLRFLYSVGPINFDYIDTTIYNKTREMLFAHELGVAAQFKEKWGSINISLQGSNYFHNPKFNRLSLQSTLNLRIFKGFSLSLQGGVTMIHDQLNLPKGEVSSEDVLLRRRQLASQYDFWGSIGFNYSFGSIYNNVVNPRFGN
ncbi:MAG: hypothetical protein PHD06_09635 [Bacteroidales bacterium]|jgi:hypothetical protein|nr:hypothetical protein [Bacteroidales bacterium]